MSTWRATKAHPPTPVLSSPAKRRLYLLATNFVARGMAPEEAYRTALRYVQGSGRGRTWISAVAEQEDRGERGTDDDQRDAAAPVEQRPDDEEAVASDGDAFVVNEPWEEDLPQGSNEGGNDHG